MTASILVYDLMISGAEFSQNRWRLTGGRDDSDKSDIKDPYFVFGIPPSKLIKIDEPAFSRKITDSDEVDKLLQTHKFLAFNFPEGNEIAIEEIYYYGRRGAYGQNLSSSSPEELIEFYNSEMGNMSAFQKQNFLDRWGHDLGILS